MQRERRAEGQRPREAKRNMGREAEVKGRIYTKGKQSVKQQASNKKGKQKSREACKRANTQEGKQARKEVWEVDKQTRRHTSKKTRM